MKLTNSVLPLKNMLDATVYATKGFQSSAKKSYAELKANPNIDDAFKAIRFSIWYALNTTQRDTIINHSNIPCVGGYNDSHLDALLRKVIPTTTIIKIVA